MFVVHSFEVLADCTAIFENFFLHLAILVIKRVFRKIERIGDRFFRCLVPAGDVLRLIYLKRSTKTWADWHGAEKGRILDSSISWRVNILKYSAILVGWASDSDTW